ncbi:midasin [Suhomyces tanzawaensis NRRL Y-17324]|uniref:Midasin n=1 Tax=Suhomyces tanzawaensis NRRL Y-17324 TaxID=984487 RepID=A0A1E4SHD5_9ASCO|nr:midasin [Suhomyces tanzawaensis NRRL Y-17324]ODV78832.1 midasin [Suhomyces tanzawaensis NRRL Y-17324]
MLSNNGINNTDQLLETTLYDNIFAEAIDCFGSSITEYNALVPLVNVIGDTLEIPTSRINLFLTNHVPNFIEDSDHIKVGRATLTKSLDKTYRGVSNQTSFAKTNHSLRLMEQVGVSIQMIEPILLVGETGTGKTTIVQQIAKMMNKKLIVINVSQQTESGDLLGGYKPVNAKTMVVPIQDEFQRLFLATFSKKKNEKFAQLLGKCLSKNQWKNVIRLWREALKLAREVLKASDSDDESPPSKKRKLTSNDKTIIMNQWLEFEALVQKFELLIANLENSFVFNFVEGSLVKAVKNGDWLLLDEINLASSDTLESIVDLLNEAHDQRTLLLTEKGDIEPIKAHSEFRIFGCMNPSTDIGKKDLPPSIRSRFSEIYVHSPDRDISDLLMIIDKYVHRYAVGDEWVGNDIAELYLEAKKLSETNQIVDGANQRPHFSIRTLSRTLIYVCDIVSIYGLRRSLYEGFCMSFLTLLDTKSEAILQPVIMKHTLGRLKNMKSVIKQCPPAPTTAGSAYVQFKHYWMKQGPMEPIPQPHYIITPFVEKNMLNLVRATAGRRFPILVQGPTSAGKTSMINYLANITGHKFVRINNHEHTDLQEYLGTYVSDSTGKLTFKEGVLVEALRKGHWIVLDELNLAPTDVLEALNRLLDDNRELFIPETQEVVHPHPDFMIFATQNPPGLYGGRKVLSRAFRNRFLELHFDDIPQDELEIILKERCQIAPTYGKKIVEVYRQLSIQRQSSRLFEQKNSFATLRDLFRWALREAVGYEELAANGYMLLAERVRKDDEKKVVQQVIEKVMRVKLDMDAYYEKLEEKALMSLPDTSIVWTKSMRRLAVLVFTSMKYNEPLLLVGETGCGKTTVCQIIARYLGKELVTVNAHQNTETGDILGAQRPVRNKLETKKDLVDSLTKVFEAMGREIQPDWDLEYLLELYDSINSFEGMDAKLLELVAQGRKDLAVLFEWNDGPLIQAMKQGNFFLLDEISLADDSVLERLNSVLEPERSLLLAEKGTDDAFITAHEGFEFLATMNPGGDYGKKELSPALRNRFTEIWVPSMNDFNDVREIIASKLINKDHIEPIVQFSEWYGKKFGGGHIDSGVISLRDILAWVQFINSCSKEVEPSAALLHGASMVFIDALGTNNTAYLAENEARLNEQKEECVAKLSQFANADLMKFFKATYQVSMTEEQFQSGPFSLSRIQVDTSKGAPFNLLAPTTAANCMRIVRAMQVHKPILLEGSPGVGKTSLITALAKATGNPLIRINLSEQTDLIDLFGSDTPAEGGKTGEFVWRDAPFLRAMQRGEWVLLDEMNLASQSVLEGLNACLDHRGEAYIPELDKSFTCHPEFKVFAAQNPQYQGGGRKGLPKSFVNRFSVVYVDVLKSQDLNMISNHLYPNVGEDAVAKLIQFISQLEEQIVVQKKWGSLGGPWEFNLRDTLRWFEMYSSKFLVEDLNDFFNMIICQRFRCEEDRAKARELFESIFGPQVQKDVYYSITDKYLQVGDAIIERKRNVQYRSDNLLPLQSNFKVLESAIRCINHNLPLIITGPSNAGKTELIRFLGGVIGVKIDEFAMNNDVDSMDILGGYEQVDYTRSIIMITDKVYEQLNEMIVININSDKNVVSKAVEFLDFLYSNEIGVENYDTFHALFGSNLEIYSNDTLTKLYQESTVLSKKIQQDKSIKFDWFDGLLVQAVEKGNWLILDNANLCNPSVLDRLNSLLETDGVLIINECNNSDGQPRVIKPHPEFRLFLTVDPKYGELSRAMRNRGIEIFLDKLDVRMTSYDKKLLGFEGSAPVVKFFPSSSSEFRPFALLDDIFEASSNVQEAVTIGFSVLPFDLLVNSNWISFVVSSSQFSSHTKSLAQSLLAIIEYGKSTGLINRLHSIYQPIQEYVNELLGFNTLFSYHQVPHPLLNPNIVPIISKLNPWVGSSESNYFFEVITRVIKSNTTIKSIEEQGLNGKVNELSYIERSAAYHLGRNIKNVPRLEIFKFMKQTSEFIEMVFQKLIGSMFQSQGVYQSLYEFQSIWEGMLETSQEQDESKLRVYQEMMSKWVKTEDSGDSSIKPYLDEIKQTIHTFVQKLNLSTGSSMDLIWETCRGDYPKNEQSWENLKRLISLADDFDEIADEQFGDARESVLGLRKLIVEVYQDIVTDRMNDEGFQELYDTLSSGIKSLKEVSSKFVIKRDNSFKKEVSMIANFIESQGLMNGQDVSEKIVELASEGNTSTISLLNNNQGILFKPYPSIFKKLWKADESLVPGLFYSDLILSSLTKIQKLPGSSGKYLQQKLDDIDHLKRALINNSLPILSNQISSFKDLLVKWIHQFLIIHLDSFNEQDKVVLQNLDLASIKEYVSSIVQIVENSSDEAFRNIALEYFIPALILISDATSQSVKALGKAWILFSCGSIQLYLPSSSYDPAIKEYVIYKKFNDQKEASEKIINAWKIARQVLMGDEISGIEKLLPSVDANNSPSRPRVFRTQKSIDTLFEEWNAFMESTIDVEPIRTLLESAEQLNDSTAKRTEMFQNNSNQFLLRLRKKHFIYSDLNDILVGYIYGLKFGFDLLSSDSKNDLSKYQFDPLWLVNVVGLTDESSCNEMFENAKVLTKSLPIDSSVSEHLMSFFMRLSFVHSSESSILEQALQSLYYRWSLRRIKQEEAEAQQGSLYKYNDTEGDAEEDFKSMFPDYEEVVGEVDTKSSKKNDSFEEIYFMIAKMYMNEFVMQNDFNIQSLVNDGAEIIELMSNILSESKKSQNNPSILASLIAKISASHQEFTNSLNHNLFDFYHGNSSSESKKAIKIITNIHTSVLKLLEQWPEHSTLQNIAVATNEYLQVPIEVPLSRLLQKIEQIYTLISEWEKYASSEVTLKVFFDELTVLIVSWRKLELSTWKALFSFEETTLEKNLGKWWFHLFEVIMIPILGKEYEDLTPVKLLAALNLFMSQSTYGEYASRLNLLRSFRNHILRLQQDVQAVQDVHNALCNFIQFYEQFIPLITEAINTTKVKLEKDINEVILLASWKDVNIDALKQSSRKSHNNLYKIVRKYRALLATSVSSLIQGGLTEVNKTVISVKELPLITGHVSDKEDGELCSTISTWSQRPTRLQNLTMVEKNMNTYVSRIIEDEIPNIYGYAKDTLEQMEQLRKETPKELKKDNKKIVAALKTQKRKLLSDTIRELRRIGLKTTLRADIMEFQGTTNVILVNSTNFGDSILKGSDGYFFRILDLLPRLRASVSEVAEDVPAADAQKGLAAAENLIHSLIATRGQLNTFANGLGTVDELFLSFEKLANVKNNNDVLVRASVVDSSNMNIMTIKKILYWLPKIIDHTIEIIQANAMGDNVLKILMKAKFELTSFSQTFKTMDSHIYTGETVKCIEKFQNFYQIFSGDIRACCSTTAKDTFIAELINQWILTSQYSVQIQSSTSLNDLRTVEDVELAYRDLSSAIIVTIQKALEVIAEPVSEEDDGWLKTSQQRLFKLIKSLHYPKIIHKINRCIELASQVEHSIVSSNLVSALTSFTLPLVKHYVKLCWNTLGKSRTNYLETSHATFILTSSLHTLATKGFCSPEPPTEQKEDSNLQDGTGLGDGEGQNTGEVGDDEDLSEDAQTENKEKEEKDEGDEDENDDAVDMDGDMAGDLEEASDQDDDGEGDDEEGEDLDEEVDDIDDLDPNAIDEKMWDEEAKDDKEKESDNMPENSKNDDITANEDEDQSSDKKPNDANEGKEEENDDENDKEEKEEAEDGEEEDVGEQEDEVKNDENEKLDDYVPETETLDLPEDMKLDGDDEEDDEGDDGEFDDKMEDQEEDKNESNDVNNEEEEVAEQGQEDEVMEDAEQEGDDQDENADQNQEQEEEEAEEAGEAEAGEDAMESDEETVGEKDEEKKEEGGNDNELDQETAEGADAANDDNNDDDVDMESAVKQEYGEKGDGADNQVVDENEDIGATGGASTDMNQQDENEDNTNQDEARDQAKESLKQLGDSLKEFHRRRQEIQQASQEKEEKVDQSANERPDEFEHVEGENAEFDTQALGAADKDQIQSIDEDMAIDDDENDETHEIKEEPETKPDEDNMDVDENAEEVDPEEGNIDPDNDFEGKTKGAFIGERKQTKDDGELIYNKDLQEEELDEYVQLDNLQLNDLNDDAPIELETARELWRKSELATQELASGLCEQLRLILEPTLATKLRGDYKTGKRLNMKRIITYIASEFRKDKIWLRRTKPSKRQYQIMIAVDDSKSMSESKSTELAYHSIALVSKALTQLESGGLSIVRFGEDIKVVHPFDKPFNNQETGSRIFQWFDFQQTKTDIKQLCAKSLKIFEDARATSNSDLWQLQIILSDGVCEDHETIQRMVRKAREEKIMLVFVVIDGINSNESILDMSQVSYVPDPNTGAMNLKVDKYLDTFPFEFYVVVRDINELPEMLSLILRQYFSEMASA